MFLKKVEEKSSSIENAHVGLIDGVVSKGGRAYDSCRIEYSDLLKKRVLAPKNLICHMILSSRYKEDSTMEGSVNAPRHSD